MTNLTNPFEAISLQIESLRAEVLDLKGSISVPRAENKKYYSIQEASKKMGVSRITIYRGTESGRIPSKKVGSRVLIPSSFLEMA